MARALRSLLGDASPSSSSSAGREARDSSPSPTFDPVSCPACFNNPCSGHRNLPQYYLAGSMGSQSLLSRFTSPFSTKAWNHVDLSIELAEPWRSHAPGDVICGNVKVVVQKALRITHLTLKLHGFVKVSKRPYAPGEIPSIDEGWMGSGDGRNSADGAGKRCVKIFEHEGTVCGEGKLTPGVYKIDFSRKFESGIPSSLDFERGTITYLLTATLTRPTPIAPTLTAERKVKVVEGVDVAFVPTPQPRSVSMKPMSRTRMRPRYRSRAVSKDNIANPQGATPESPGSAGPEEQANGHSRPSTGEVAESSRASCDSESVSTGDMVESSYTDTGDRDSGDPSASKPIRATVELQRGGYLPGDTIPLKVHIEHTKVIKSHYGVIATLYRRARVDTTLPRAHPATQGIEGQNPLPRSRSGLGGLSLSTTAQSAAFRMDMDQSFKPLFIDPVTLTATIHTSVKVPDYAFPTILNVPGNMISFQYCLEILLDLKGKLGNQERLRPRLNMMGPLQGYSSESHDYGLEGHVHSKRFVETELIRHEKLVCHLKFDVVIGTKDSLRRYPKKGHESHESQKEVGIHLVTPGAPASAPETPVEEIRASQELDDVRRAAQSTPQPVPMHPPPAFDEPADEKARIRLAELRLLPSQAPEAGEGSSSAAASFEPSAPAIEEIEGQEGVSAAPAYSPAAPPPAPSVESGHGAAGPPTSEAGGPGGPPVASSSDDKQELERERLLAMASAPPDEGEDTGEGASSSHPMVPAAPAIDEDEELNSPSFGAALPTERLPVYER